MRRRTRRLPNRRDGFSLVECALALGIISFCLVALIGLLPTGLDTIKNSREQAGAATAMESIAAALRTARVIPGMAKYQAGGAYTNLKWDIGGGIQQFSTMTDVSLLGSESTDPGSSRLAVNVEITPPASAGAVTNARISVAWPSTAVYDTSSKKWKAAQGSLSAWVIFLPAP